MKRNPSKTSGFSLVEVLAAVAIIGILVFIAIPNVVQSRRDAEENFAIGRAEALNSAISQYIQANGRANAGSSWTGASNDGAKFDLVKGYLAYAPTQLSDYVPTGYIYTMPATPDGRVDIKRQNGQAQDPIYY
ncbi:MAG TPA: type II secretion system protein [Verrucomicrobiales bacterium]|jgi:prepilin-type N-terminal cleavage/methylation domain-containing protein|nr:type II secretion system protein [Verrucomicrobiales bacterium]